MEQPARLETNRLTLNGINPAYIHFLFSSKTKDEMLFFGFDEKRYLHYKKMHEGGMETYQLSLFVFLLVDKSTAETIGVCGFHTWDRLHRRAELFYVMYNERHRKKGLMTEAVKAVIRYGFETLQLHRIQAMIDAGNTASLKILTANRFVKEGTLREDYFVNGLNEDSQCYSLLKWEWQAETAG